MQKILFPSALDISNEAYHGDTSRISKSGLDKIGHSPAHYYAAYLDPNRKERKTTAALVSGKAAHVATFEPHLFDAEYTVLDDSKICDEIGGAKPRSTTKYKDWYNDFTAQNQGKELLSAEDYEISKRVAEAVHKTRAIRDLIADGYAEQTFFFTDSETGAACKTRPDFIPRTQPVILDLKTTEDARGIQFGRSAKKYGYDIQAPFYCDGVNESIGSQVFSDFIFIAVEKEPPFAVGLYAISAADMHAGRSLYRDRLRQYQKAKMSGYWPAYSPEITPLLLPGKY